MAKILAADIGGTNSRFALFDDANGELVMEDSIWLKTHGAESFAQLLTQLWESDFQAKPGGFDSAALAVAGAVRDGVECPYLPNAPWGVDLRKVDFRVRKACLINDFAAQAYACRTRAVKDAMILQGGEEEDGVIGVIGAGTGLGYSALIKGENEWVALPSEGGHMAFPFTGKKEAEYSEFNRRASGRNWAEGDSVVTGLGLQLVHKFLTGEDKSPADISEAITPESETTKWYARFYARACRNWSIALMCKGGLYIAGGIAAKNPMFVNVPEFLEEFHNSHVYEEFLYSVPIKLNTNEESGLLGAGLYAMQLLGR
ncbi:glucokinase [Pseudodesulfovibrio sp. zrk46]|uniref:glucokinase n=1 Tax=Pseudodesulfovibrio sp. zrk46 TaxID=2725288 RepID=UPI001449332E|nr:glucokinase [Pseudodesulfovibrio sp. zrk46]QJB57612.1 glucokinase [Pseudodesulfovibrio sp. zrk46]